MSADAIFATTMALRRRISGGSPAGVHIGAPLRGEMGTATVALFLFHVAPSADLRNVPRMRPLAPGAPVGRPAQPVEAIAHELHFLITCFRPPGGQGAEPSELRAMGEIIARLHADPVLTGAVVPGQEVRITPASYSMEEINRIWGLLSEEPLRTSLVYLATPVFIELAEAEAYPAVQSRQIAGGLAADPRAPGARSAA